MSSTQPLPIGDVWLIAMDVFRDSRGAFEVSWEHPYLRDQRILFSPSSSYHSYNAASQTLRGLHFQKAPHGQAKLVSCVSGRAWDVVVDLRKESTTFGRWHATELSAASGRSVLIPAGCAHGFVTLEAHTTIAYLIEGEYVPAASRALKWDDSRLGIDWPIRNPTLSEKDAAAPGWDQCEF